MQFCGRGSEPTRRSVLSSMQSTMLVKSSVGRWSGGGVAVEFGPPPAPDHVHGEAISLIVVAPTELSVSIFPLLGEHLSK